VAAFVAAGSDQPLQYHARYSGREIAFLPERERVVQLDDLVLRRTAIAILGELTPALLDELLGIMGEALGWSRTTQQEEADRLIRLLEQRHGIRWTRKETQ
jgi:glycerol-3-phosphate dehydrogenase